MWDFRVAQRYNSACQRRTQVRPLGQEDFPEVGSGIDSSLLAWRIPWTEEPGGLQSWGHKETRQQQIRMDNVLRSQSPD